MCCLLMILGVWIGALEFSGKIGVGWIGREILGLIGGGFGV